jgi:hypothetical protein
VGGGALGSAGFHAQRLDRRRQSERIGIRNGRPPSRPNQHSCSARGPLAPARASKRK